DASVRSRGPERGYDTRVGSRVAASSWGSLPRTAAEATTPRQPLPGAPPEAPRRCIHAPCGIVEGWIDGEVLRATGIRYARAARFGEPAPEPDADGILDATAWSPAAPQYPDLALEAMFGAQQRPLRMDEHCQYLSVTAPADLAPGEELPVMVWIDGGSYLTGAGDSEATDPAELVAEQRVVVVTVTYPLGLPGSPGRGARGSNPGLPGARPRRAGCRASCGRRDRHLPSGPARVPRRRGPRLEPGAAAPGPGAALGAPQHRRLRRERPAGHRFRRIGGWRRDRPPAA